MLLQVFKSNTKCLDYKKKKRIFLIWIRYKQKFIQYEEKNNFF